MKQTIKKTPLDFASFRAMGRLGGSSLRKAGIQIDLVNNLQYQDNMIKTHNIDQFVPEPKDVFGDSVKVERRTTASAILKGAGEYLNAISQTAMLAGDLIRDLKKGDLTGVEKKRHYNCRYC